MSRHCVYYWREMHINSASKLHDGYAQENEKKWESSSETSKLFINVF